jgi:hypothetical protein
MKSPNWIAVCGAALSLAFAIVSLYFAFAFHFAVGLVGSPTFSVDQILAALTLMVGLVGLIVAIAAIAVAIVAVFGYGEIRQITSRRTDELLRKVILSLRKRGEISSLEARTLLQGIEDEELAKSEPPAAGTASKGEEKEKNQTADKEEELKKYPSTG